MTQGCVIVDLYTELYACFSQRTNGSRQNVSDKPRYYLLNVSDNTKLLEVRWRDRVRHIVLMTY